MSCTRGGMGSSMALCLTVACAGCIGTTSRFVQSDKSYQAKPRTAPPQVFVQRVPAKPFASVGIVQVQAPVTAPTETLIKAAIVEGTKLGCDVLVHEALYEQRRGTPRRKFANGVASWLFTCGVFDVTRRPQETAQLADAAAEEIVRSEFGEIVCASEERTGSHIPRRVCRLPGAYQAVTIVHALDHPLDPWYWY